MCQTVECYHQYQMACYIINNVMCNSQKCFLNAFSQCLLPNNSRTQHSNEGGPVCWLFRSRSILPMLEHIGKTVETLSATVDVNCIYLRLAHSHSHAHSLPLCRYLSGHSVHELHERHCITCTKLIYKYNK